MLLLCWFVVVALYNNFCTCTVIPIAIAEDSVIPVNATASTPVWHTDPPEPSFHPGYRISNVGKAVIRASIYWKDSWPLQTDDVFCEAHVNCSTNSSANIWFELPDAVLIDPLETRIIMPSANPFYYTRLVIVSNQPEGSSNLLEAIVNVEYEAAETGSARRRRKKRETESTLPKLPLSDNLKTLFRYGGRRLPTNWPTKISGIGALVELFWPENEPSVWDEVRDHVRHLVDPETFTYINTLLNGRLTVFKIRLAEIAREMNEKQWGISYHYMNIAQDLIGLEAEFMIRNHHNAKKLNFDLLPLYSNVVLMKVAYYNLGRKCRSGINFNSQDSTLVKSYLNSTIHSPKTGANYHIFEVFKAQQNFSADREYDKIMSARNMVNEHGYVPVWNNMIDYPEQTLFDERIIYSELIGRQNDEILRHARDQPKWPLTPALQPDGKYSRLETLTTYLSSYKCNSNSENTCIKGIKPSYQNTPATYVFGHDYDPNPSPSVHRFVKLDESSWITSIIIEQLDSNTVSLRVAVEKSNRICNNDCDILYYDLGRIDAVGWKNVSLEIPGYKVGSIFSTWSGKSIENIAVSFVPKYSNFVDYREENWSC